MEISFPTPPKINHHFMRISRTDFVMVYVSSKEAYLTYGSTIITSKGQEIQKKGCTKDW